MEKRSSNEWDSKRVEVVKGKKKPVRKKTVPKTVRIVLLRRKNINTIGTVTGRMYSFRGAGSVLDVDERDVPSLVDKGVGGTSCCGSGLPSSSYFRLV